MITGWKSPSSREFHRTPKARRPHWAESSSAQRTRTESKILGKRDVLLQGWPGIVLTYTTADGITMCDRAYAFGDKLVMLSAIMPTGVNRPDAIDRFLESIHFPRQGGLAPPGLRVAADYSPAHGAATQSFDVFTLSAPVTLVRQASDDESPLSYKQVNTWLGQDSQTTYCAIVALLKNPAYAPVAEVLSAEVRSLIGGKGSKVLGQRDITLQGWPGVAVTVSTSDGTTTVSRVFVYEDRTVILAGSFQTGDPRPGGIDRFLGSLQFAHTGVGTLTGPHTIEELLKPGPGYVMIPQTLGGLGITAPAKLVPIEISQWVDPDVRACSCWAGSGGPYAFSLVIGVLKEPEKVETEAILAGGIAGAIRTGWSKIIDAHDVLAQGWRGIDAAVQLAADKTACFRVFHYADRVVFLAAYYGNGGPRPSAVNSFFASVHFPTDGKITVIGPTMTRYPLGDSGLSAMMPHAPTHQLSHKGENEHMGPLITFQSEYCLSHFAVTYRDLHVPDSAPKPTEEDLSKLYDVAMEGILEEGKLKKGDQREFKVDGVRGLCADVTAPDGSVGRAVIYLKNHRIVILLAMAVHGYGDPKVVDLFLHSVQTQ